MAALPRLPSDETHTVANQSTPLADYNLYTGNRALQDALAFHLGAADDARRHEHGAQWGSAEMQVHARLANVNKPRLLTHDRHGHRTDRVEFHPSYHVLLGAAAGAGLHGTPWALGPGAHVERAAAFMLFTELEPSVLCPISMTYAVTPALRANAAIFAQWFGGLASTRYDERLIRYDHKAGLTMGMGMTEKQGGSDVRANTTRAEFAEDTPWGRCYRVTGHKWFLSAPMSDAFLVLAQTPAGPSCLFMPRLLPDGSVNSIRIQRLKDKLGNHANASSEVEFAGTLAWQVGEEGRGVAQILEMGTLTRLDCALGTAGLMRQAVSLALHHCAQRHAFGKPLIEQPLMGNVLADLALESEAATALALRLARAVDRQDDPFEATMRRLLTPVSKYWICKRGAALAQEAMECLGGNGYVEECGEGVMARIYREMPVNSIWEGSGNIMALDLLRALRKGATGHVAQALAAELAAARGAHPAFDRHADALPGRIAAATQEFDARRLAQDVALAVQAALLKQHAPDFVFDAFCTSRLAGDRGDWGQAYGTLGAATDFAAIIARAMPV